MFCCHHVKEYGFLLQRQNPLDSCLCTFLTNTLVPTLGPSAPHVHFRKSFGIYTMIDFIPVYKQMPISRGKATCQLDISQADSPHSLAHVDTLAHSLPWHLQSLCQIHPHFQSYLKPASSLCALETGPELLAWARLSPLWSLGPPQPCLQEFINSAHTSCLPTEAGKATQDLESFWPLCKFVSLVGSSFFR